MKLNLDISQKQVLSPQLIQSVEILQMSSLELEKYVEDLALENPVIELPDFSGEAPVPSAARMERIRKAEWLSKTDRQNRSYYDDGSGDSIQNSLWDRRQSEETLSDHLLSQLVLEDFSETERKILEFLILSLDSSGYMTMTEEATAKHLGVDESTVIKMADLIRTLDPQGVGAESLSDCLLLQLEYLGLSDEVTTSIVRDHLEDLAKNHISKIARELHAPIEEILKACEIIRNLNPKPGSYFSNREQTGYIRPDALVLETPEGFDVIADGPDRPLFSISSYYEGLLNETEDTEAKKYLQDKLSQAKWLSGCITDRKSSMLAITEAIVDIQKEFFQKGPGHKCPLRLQDISERLSLHESTVSRAMREKYLQCKWGIFQLNYFLTPVASVSGQQEARTPEQMKAMISEIIQGEDKSSPLSDQQISDALKLKGSPLSRRTVNKYRTEMGIPDKSGRNSKNS